MPTFRRSRILRRCWSRAPNRAKIALEPTTEMLVSLIQSAATDGRRNPIPVDLAALLLYLKPEEESQRQGEGLSQAISAKRLTPKSSQSNTPDPLGMGPGPPHSRRATPPARHKPAITDRSDWRCRCDKTDRCASPTKSRGCSGCNSSSAAMVPRRSTHEPRRTIPPHGCRETRFPARIVRTQHIDNVVLGHVAAKLGNSHLRLARRTQTDFARKGILHPQHMAVRTRYPDRHLTSSQCQPTIADVCDASSAQSSAQPVRLCLGIRRPIRRLQKPTGSAPLFMITIRTTA